VDTTSIGWKNYYKYVPIVYMDLRLSISVPKTFLRDCMMLGISRETLEQVRTAVDVVAKACSIADH
jgi:hypothetical protein